MRPADHFQKIYTARAAAYHRMIAAEDVDNNLLAALEGLTPLHGQRLLDLGSGTGRIPLLVGDKVGALIALDVHAAMLREAQQQQASLHRRWASLQADMRALPLRGQQVDIITAGWALGHFCSWFAPHGKREIARALEEMHRVLRPGGTVIILETLGTGQRTPAPPKAHLGAYYRWLEEEWAFTRQVIATDYQFASVEQAVDHMTFFFGAEIAAAIRQNGWARVPEWTGVWARSW